MKDCVDIIRNKQIDGHQLLVRISAYNVKGDGHQLLVSISTYTVKGDGHQLLVSISTYTVKGDGHQLLVRISAYNVKGDGHQLLVSIYIYRYIHCKRRRLDIPTGTKCAIFQLLKYRYMRPFTVRNRKRDSHL
jgi:protein subunit release factor B